MANHYEYEGKTLAWEGRWYVDAGGVSTKVQNPAVDLAWLVGAPIEPLMLGIWDYKDMFPLEEIVVSALRDPAHASKALLWLTEVLGHSGATTRMTWNITQELHEASGDKDLSEAQRASAEALYESITARKVGRMSKEDMKEFVLGFVDGQISELTHLRDESLMGMVFMPLALGAFHIPSYALPPEPEKLELPEPPSKPFYPEEPEMGAPPVKPEEIRVEEEMVERLEFEIRWNQRQPDSVEKYKASVGEKNDLLRSEYEDALKAHEESHKAALEEWRAKCQTLDAEHEKATREHEAMLLSWEDDHDEVLSAHQEWLDLQKQQSMNYLNQIGVLWEWMSKAGPRSINGCPIFYSLRVMHREDWIKCHKAIVKETERRAALDDMFGDDEDDATEGGQAE